MNRNHLYLGKAGQSFVMSEFLARGWNVAVPEVDFTSFLNNFEKFGMLQHTVNTYFLKHIGT